MFYYDYRLACEFQLCHASRGDENGPGKCGDLQPNVPPAAGSQHDLPTNKKYQEGSLVVHHANDGNVIESEFLTFFLGLHSFHFLNDNVVTNACSLVERLGGKRAQKKKCTGNQIRKELSTGTSFFFFFTSVPTDVKFNWLIEMANDRRLLNLKLSQYFKFKLVLKY